MTLDVGDRVPARSLEAPDGSAVPLRRPRRGNTVLMLPHGPDCQGCLDRAASLLETAGDQLEAWEARLLVASPAPSSPRSASPPSSSSSPASSSSPSSASDPSPLDGWSDRLASLSPPALLALDRDGAIRERAELDDGEAALLVADRWGQVYHRSVAPDARDLSGADEIVKWARYMTIQCPECGVPDEPPGMGRWHRDTGGDADDTPALRRGPRPSST